MGLGSFLGDVLDPGDVFGRRAQEEANDIQQRTTQRGLDDQRALFEQLQADKAPVLDAQNFALDYLRRLQSGEASLPSSPGLEGRIEDQQGSLRAAMAARGKLNSGDRFTGEQDIAANLQSQDTGRTVNRLLNLAGFATGDTATQNQFLSGNRQQQAGLRSDLNSLGVYRDLNSQNFRNSALNSAAFGVGAFGGGQNQSGGHDEALRYAGYI